MKISTPLAEVPQGSLLSSVTQPVPISLVPCKIHSMPACLCLCLGPLAISAFIAFSSCPIWNDFASLRQTLLV